MKAIGGGDVHTCITVVNPVKPPEERHHVIESVPPVGPAIEQDDGENRFGPSGPVRPAKQSQPMLCRELDRQAPCRNEDQTRNREVEKGHAEIDETVKKALFSLLAEKGKTRGNTFPGEQGDQYRH